MKPKRFDKVNVVLQPPPGLEGDCVPLPVLRWTGGVLSCWELTDEEVERIVRDRHVWLNVQGVTTPPVWIAAGIDPNDLETIELPPLPPPPDIVTTEELRIFCEKWRDAHESLLESDPEEAESLLKTALDEKFSGRQLVEGGRIQ